MSNFTLRQIKTFLMVHKAKSFQAAANALHTTQPAVSQRIKELERVLGVELFQRDPRSARLTMTGRKMLPYAERMVALADEMAIMLVEKHAVSGLVKIGATDTVALTWLPKLIERLGVEYPQLEVELVIGLSVELLSALKGHDLDLAVIAVPFDGPGILSCPLGALRNCWMGSPKLIAQVGEVTPAAMARLPIFTYSEGSHQHEMIRHWFRRQGVDPLRINVCTSLAAIVKLTAAGLGLSILSPEMMAEELAAGTLQIVRPEQDLPSIDFAAAYLDSGNAEFLQQLTEIATEIVADDRTFGRHDPA